MDKGISLIVTLQIVLSWTFLGSLEAQITREDASRDFLAMQIAASSGSSADNYLEYSARLARTISSLDSSQQQRVFGYLPLSTGATSREPSYNSKRKTSPVTPEKKEKGLVDELVSGATDFLSGILNTDPEPVPEPIIAGTPPTSVENPTPADGDGNNGHGNSEGFDPSNPGASKTTNPEQAGNSEPVGEVNKGSEVPSEAGASGSGGDNWVPPGLAKKGVTSWDPPGLAKKSDPDGDGNNGHGNSGGFDPSNPGKSKK